jgi:hypothetical protein
MFKILPLCSIEFFCISNFFFPRYDDVINPRSDYNTGSLTLILGWEGEGPTLRLKLDSAVLGNLSTHLGFPCLKYIIVLSSWLAARLPAFPHCNRLTAAPRCHAHRLPSKPPNIIHSFLAFIRLHNGRNYDSPA